MSVSSPIITSSISLQCPSFTSSGWSKVEVISPPDQITSVISEGHIFFKYLTHEEDCKTRLSLTNSLFLCVCICIHTGDESEALNASEVGVLDGHDASLSEELLWVVIDELPVRIENKTNTGVSDTEIK